MTSYSNHSRISSLPASDSTTHQPSTVYQSKYTRKQHIHTQSDQLSAASSVSDRNKYSNVRNNMISDQLKQSGELSPLSSDSSPNNSMSYTPNKYTNGKSNNKNNINTDSLQLSNILSPLSPPSPDENQQPSHINIRAYANSNTGASASIINDKLQLQVNELQRSVTSLKSELQLSKEHNTQLQSTLSSTTDELKQYKSDAVTHRLQSQHYCAEIELLNNTIKSMKLHEEELLKQIRHQSTEIASHRSVQSISLQPMTTHHTPRESIDITSKYVRDAAVAEERYKQLQLQYNTVNTELIESKRMVDELTTTCAQHTAELVKYSSDVSKLKEQRDIMLIQHSDAMKLKDDAVVQYKSELKHLRYDTAEQINILNSVIKSNQTTVEQLQLQYNDMKLRLQGRDDELRNITHNKINQQPNSRTDSTSGDIWRDQQILLTKQINELQSQLQLATRDNELDKLNRVELEKQLGIVSHSKKELNDRCRDTEQKLYETIEQRSILQQQVDALTKQLSTTSSISNNVQCGSVNGCYASRLLENQLQSIQTQHNTLLQRYNTIECNEQLALQQSTEYQHKYEVECIKHESTKQRHNECKLQCDVLSQQTMELNQQINTINQFSHRFDHIDALLQQLPHHIVQHGVDYISHDNTLNKYTQQVELMSPAQNKRPRKASVTTTAVDKSNTTLIKPPLAFGSNVPRSQQLSVTQRRNSQQTDVNGSVVHDNNVTHSTGDHTIHTQIGELFGNMNGVLIEHIQSIVQQSIDQSIHDVQRTLQSSIDESITHTTQLHNTQLQQLAQLHTVIRDSVTDTAQTTAQTQLSHIQQMLDNEFMKYDSSHKIDDMKQTMTDHTTELIDHITLNINTLCSKSDVKQLFIDHSTEQTVSETVIDNINKTIDQLQQSMIQSIESSNTLTLHAQNESVEKLCDMLSYLHTTMRHNHEQTQQDDNAQHKQFITNIEQLQQSIAAMASASYEKLTSIQQQSDTQYNGLIHHVDSTHKQLCNNISDTVESYNKLQQHNHESIHTAVTSINNQQMIDIMHVLHQNIKQVVRDNRHKNLVTSDDLATLVHKSDLIELHDQIHSIHSTQLCRMDELHSKFDINTTQLHQLDRLHDRIDRVNTVGISELHTALSDHTSKLDRLDVAVSQLDQLDVLNNKLDRHIEQLNQFNINTDSSLNELHGKFGKYQDRLNVLDDVHNHTNTTVTQLNKLDELHTAVNNNSTRLNRLDTIYEQFIAHAQAVHSNFKSLHHTHNELTDIIQNINMDDRFTALHSTLDIHKQSYDTQFNQLHTEHNNTIVSLDTLNGYTTAQTQSISNRLEDINNQFNQQNHSIDHKLHTLASGNESLHSTISTQLQQLTKQTDLYHICEIIQSHITAALYGLPAELNKSLINDINHAINTGVKSVTQQQYHELTNNINNANQLLSQLRTTQDSVVHTINELPTSKQLHDISFNTSVIQPETTISRAEFSKLYDHITGLYERIINITIPNMDIIQHKLDELHKLQSTVLDITEQCPTYQHVTDELSRTQNSISIQLGNLQQQQSLQTETIRSIQQYSQQHAIYQQSHQLEKSITDMITVSLGTAPTYHQLESLTADVKQLVQQHGLTQIERDSITNVTQQVDHLIEQFSAAHSIQSQTSDTVQLINRYVSELAESVYTNQQQLMNTVPSKDDLMTAITASQHELNTTINIHYGQLNSTMTNNQHELITTMTANQQQLNHTITDDRHVIVTSISDTLQHSINTLPNKDELNSLIDISTKQITGEYKSLDNTPIVHDIHQSLQQITNAALNQLTTQSSTTNQSIQLLQQQLHTINDNINTITNEQQSMTKTITQLPVTFYETERSLSYVIHQQTQTIKNVIDDVSDRQEEISDVVNTLATRDDIHDIDSTVQNQVSSLVDLAEQIHSNTASEINKHFEHYLEALHQRVQRIAVDNNNCELIQSIHNILMQQSTTATKPIDRTSIVEADLTQAQLNDLHEKLDSLHQTVTNTQTTLQTPQSVHRPNTIQSFTIDHERKPDMTASMEHNNVLHNNHSNTSSIRSRSSSHKVNRARKSNNHSKTQSMIIEGELKSEPVEFEHTTLHIDTTRRHMSMKSVELSPLPLHSESHDNDELHVTLEDSMIEWTNNDHAIMCDTITSPIHVSNDIEYQPVELNNHEQYDINIIQEEDNDILLPTRNNSPEIKIEWQPHLPNVLSSMTHQSPEIQSNPTTIQIDDSLTDMDDPHTVQTVLEIMWRFLRKVVVRSIEDIQIQQIHLDRLQQSGNTIEINDGDIVIDINDIDKFNDLLHSIPEHTQQHVTNTLNILHNNGFTAERMMSDITNDINSLIQQYITVHQNKLLRKHNNIKSLGWSCAAILFGSILMSTNNTIDTYHA